MKSALYTKQTTKYKQTNKQTNKQKKRIQQLASGTTGVERMVMHLQGWILA